MVDSADVRCSRRDLDLDTLSERHYGITTEIGASYAQAASVCLSRRHVPSAIMMISTDDQSPDPHRIDWTVPTERVQASWANHDDATRDGAYGIVLAAADSHLGLVTLGRAIVGSGADYLIGPGGTNINSLDGLIDYETAIRLEVSGIDRCRGESALERRVRQKVRQALAGNSIQPAIAGVVAFDMLRIVFRSVS